MGKPIGTLLLTGAAGGLGRMLRERVGAWAELVRLSDCAPMAPARDGEQLVQCDLADRAAVLALLDGVDAVLHFGGISVEAPFAPIMQANIIGMANLYEAVHKAGVKRVVYASSNHSIGYYQNTELVDATMPVRPDGMYGVSKCFGEALSRYYFDRFGIETVCLRIGSCIEAPRTRRMLSTYLSHDDLVELLRCSLFTPRVGHCIVFGMSDNAAPWWDNRHASHLGYRPRDSASRFAPDFPDSANYPGPDEPALLFHGGGFVLDGPQYDT